MFISILGAFALLFSGVLGAVPLITPLSGPNSFPPLPVGTPVAMPAYMQDNQGNTNKSAPDKGTYNGPVLPDGSTTGTSLLQGQGTSIAQGSSSSTNYWLANIGHGKSPYAPSNYTFYRSVTAYGAKGDGIHDDTAAINAAIVAGSRCGNHCGSTTVLGALIFFPPGTYLVSSPIIQYYYTQFVGDPTNLPTILGAANFSGIALIDTDVYIPGGNGNEWYINQNQFYRQIRNFIIDMTQMPRANTQGDQTYVPTGIHWQVAQATSLQNIQFKMSVSDSQGSATAVGIFMENGSGGFVSDLTFTGGNIGFNAGSQQFTARNLTFTSCLTAVVMIWDWGFTWQDITITSCYIAFNTSVFGGITGQGTGSISVVDSTFNAVPYGIVTHAQGPTPNIVLDNVYVTNPYDTPASVVQVAYGSAFLAVPAYSSMTVQSWGIGRRYTSLSDTGSYVIDNFTPQPSKPASLLSSGKYFTRSKPQYESLGAGSFISVTSKGVKNDGTGDQTSAINSVLAGAGNSVVFFPQGVYLVAGTIKVPVGTRMLGEGWSQIMASGSYFQDAANPKVMVQVGNAGDRGVIEISDMLFTVSGPTAGCILVEWNVHESSQGSAGMWDAHFRVGGATGSNLQLSQCPSGTQKTKCYASSLLLHLTSKSSGYFENVWAWVSDHDLDSPLNANEQDDKSGVPQASDVQLSIYGARGILIESQGPSWFYGTASEHSVLYQYELLGAKNIYLGHMQTETPYFQPNPPATQPFTIGQFSGDPTFDTCIANSSCASAWALRIINSTNVFIYSAGFYSFFQNFDTYCNPLENCQEKVIDTAYSQGIWLYNIFTRGVVQIVSPQGGIPPVFQNDSNQAGYTSEISAWLPLALTGGSLGGETGTASTHGNVSILPLPCTTVPPSSTFTMSAACTSGIIQLPTSGPNASIQNDPSGYPPVCNEICDFYRLLSGTCCGNGGGLGNPIVIPPSVTIPWDIPLPSGFIPNVNITIPIPGLSNPTSVFGNATTSYGTTTVTYPATTITSTYPATTILSTVPATTATITSGGKTSTVISSARTTTITSGARTSTITSPQRVSTITGGGSNPSKTHGCGIFPPDTPLSIFGAHIPLVSAITLPAGFCNPLPTPIIIPPRPLPNNDPPCFPPANCHPCGVGLCPPGIGPPPGGDSTQPPSGDEDGDPDSCSNDASPSDETGLCPNGNYPLWDPATGAIDCDVPMANAAQYISSCQAEADDNYNDTMNAIKCYDTECSTPSKLRKRAVPNACKPPYAYSPGPPPGSNLQCDATFNCDTDEWPNVCNNAKSAIVNRGAPSVLTFYGQDVHLTERWLDLHGIVRNGNQRLEGGGTDARRDNGDFTAVGGWGLIGCQVEEYPFGNSWQADPGPIARYNNRPTLRLIPQEENGLHGGQLGQFIRYAQHYATPNFKQNIVYCVQITGNTQPSDYCINSGAACKNKCAAAYGPAFILVNDATLADQQAAVAAGLTNEQRWDKWFDGAASRKPVHTISFDPVKLPQQVPVTTTMPPQFAPCPSPCPIGNPAIWPAPAPGQKIYRGTFPNGQWVNSYTVNGKNIVVGIPASRPQADYYGRNLRWDAPPPNGGFPSKHRRSDDDSVESVFNETAKAGENRTVLAGTLDEELFAQYHRNALRQLSPRQVLGGSFLDPAVFYDVLECPVGDVDVFGDNTYATYPAGAGADASTTVHITTSGASSSTVSSGKSSASSSSNSKATTSPSSTKPTTTIQSSTTPVYPTDTSIVSGQAYCYTKAQGYSPMNATGINVIINSMCNSGYTLSPGNAYGYVNEYTDPTGVKLYTSVQWAPNQSGCPAEQATKIQGDQCGQTYDNILNACGASPTADYGGGLVSEGPDAGCILWEIYAHGP